MKIIEEGDKVSIIIEVKLENGEHCYGDKNENTLDLVVGEGKIFPALEKELLKMKEGETKDILLEPNDAFGTYHNELVLDAPRNNFRSEDNLTIGMRMKIDSPSGKSYYGIITDISNEAITLDLNHPLAGKKIVFTVTINTIEKK